MLTVQGKAKVVAEVRYPESFVHCEMLAEVKFDVASPETVSVPLEFERPLPVSLLNDEPLKTRFVVEAVRYDE